MTGHGGVLRGVRSHPRAILLRMDGAPGTDDVDSMGWISHDFRLLSGPNYGMALSRNRCGSYFTSAAAGKHPVNSASRLAKDRRCTRQSFTAPEERLRSGWRGAWRREDVSVSHCAGRSSARLRRRGVRAQRRRPAPPVQAIRWRLPAWRGPMFLHRITGPS